MTAASYAWAIPGARVVCVNDDFGFIQQGTSIIPTRHPMMDEVLTIREVEPGQQSDLCCDPNGVFLSFWEIDRHHTSGPLSADISWSAECFLPLIEQKADISVFTALLTPAKQTEDA